MDKELKSRIRWMIGMRVVLATLLLSSSLLLRTSSDPLLAFAFYPLIGAAYLLTIVYALILPQVNHGGLYLFAGLQIGLDLLLETALVVVTGGIESFFTFLYPISIVSAAQIFSLRGGFGAASAATFLYGFLLNLQVWGFSPFSGGVPLKQSLYALVLNVISFFTVAFLAGHLAEKLRSTRQRLAEQEVSLQDIVSSVSSGLVTTDRDGRVTSFNRAASEITGYSSSGVLGGSLEKIFGLDAIRATREEILRTAAPQRFEWEIVTASGERALLGFTVSPLKNTAGQISGLIGIFQDLTQIRRLEEEMKERERLAIIGEMAAGMAHEIRNPLAALSGSIEVLRDELPDDADTRRLLEILLKETDRLNKIITDFLLYARPRPLNRSRFMIRDLLLENLELLRRSSPPNVEVRLDVSANVAAGLDADQMKQVFFNLAINAFEAMPGGGLLVIGLKGNREGMVEEGMVEISFRDTGTGIPPAVLPKIFNPFFTTKENGSGLGLAIVRRILDEHGGRVKVASGADGTMVRVLLPALPGQEVQTKAIKHG